MKKKTPSRDGISYWMAYLIKRICGDIKARAETAQHHEEEKYCAFSSDDDESCFIKKNELDLISDISAKLMKMSKRRYFDSKRKNGSLSAKNRL